MQEMGCGGREHKIRQRWFVLIPPRYCPVLANIIERVLTPTSKFELVHKDTAVCLTLDRGKITLATTGRLTLAATVVPDTTFQPEEERGTMERRDWTSFDPQQRTMVVDVASGLYHARAKMTDGKSWMPTMRWRTGWKQTTMTQGQMFVREGCGCPGQMNRTGLGTTPTAASLKNQPKPPPVAGVNEANNNQVPQARQSRAGTIQA